MKKPFVIENWYGGQASSDKQGPPASFAYSRHIDFRKDPSAITILPKTVKETGSVVTGLVTQMVKLPSGKIVAIDDAGGVYTRSTSGVWAKDGTSLTDTACGMVYHYQHDTIYIPGLTAMHSITNADGRFSGGVFTVNSSTFGASLDDSATDSANTYTTTTSVNEGATHKLSFTPDIEPLYSVKIWVTTKGTGDLTVTMHDAANNLLGSKTVAIGSITNAALNEFVFSTPIRMSAKPNPSTYHFHITHDGAGTASTIGAGTSGDFSTARFENYGNRFVDPINNFHPAANFLQYLVFGNERYLSVWEPISQVAPANTEYLRHRLTFEPGYEVCGLATYNEFLAIAVEKRSTTATSEVQDGRIYMWNGTSANFDFYIPVPEGSPYSIQSYKNILYWTAGGAWWGYAGGEPVKMKTFPNTDSEYSDLSDATVVNPNMATVRRGVFLMGYPTSTTNLSLQHGVYSWGALEKNYDDSFGYSYTMSTGTRLNTGSNNLRIGMVRNYGDTLFVAWRDGTDYGVDTVSNTSDPFSEATIESLVFDGGRPDKDKQALKRKVTFEALPTGCTVTPKYKINRAANWTSGTAAVAGETEIDLNINERFKEIQFAIDLVATTTTSKVTSDVTIIEVMDGERD